jgi:hypothetical protein
MFDALHRHLIDAAKLFDDQNAIKQKTQRKVNATDSSRRSSAQNERKKSSNFIPAEQWAKMSPEERKKHIDKNKKLREEQKKLRRANKAATTSTNTTTPTTVPTTTQSSPPTEIQVNRTVIDSDTVAPSVTPSLRQVLLQTANRSSQNSTVGGN